MATSDRRHLINVHSSKIDKVPGVDSNDMRYGELAVNHFKGKAFISTRVSDTEMELFPSVHYIEQYPFSSLKVNGLTTLSGTTKIEKIEAGDNTFDKALDSNSTNAVQNKVITKIIEDNEKIVSSALNDLNDRKLDASAYTPTDLSDYYKKEETSGKTDLDNAFNLKANASDLTTHTSDSTVHITSDERNTWNDASTNSHTHANKSILDSINGIDTELSETSNNLVVNSAITKVIEDNEKNSSAALNELNERKLDASAYTPTDLSDYYKKEETSGKSDIDTALNLKANTSALTDHTENSNIHITPEERNTWNGKFSNVQYDSKDKKINFYSGETTETPVAYINANDFIQVETGTVDLSDYYKKEETSGSTALTAAFNSKANASDLTDHINNSTIHITGDERTKWDNAATSSHTHLNKDVLDKITAIDAELSETSNNLVVNSAITTAIQAKETAISTSINDLYNKKLDATAYTPTDLSNYYTREETSGKSDIDTALSLKANASDLATKANIADLTNHIGDNVVHITSDERNTWNGKISSAQYSSADKRINFYSGATTENPVSFIDATDFIQVETGTIDLSVYYKKSETSGSTQLSDAFNLKANESDLTTHTGNSDIHITPEERTKWNNATSSSHTHANKETLDKITGIDTELSKTSNNLVVNSAITMAIQANKESISTSFNDLANKKLDATAYTPTDLSDYYKMEETSGKTDLDNAFNSKANASDLTAHTKNKTIHITPEERNTWNGKFSNVQYDSDKKRINFYSGTTTENPVAHINANDFIQQATGSIDLSKYYMKDETSGSSELNDAFGLKANASDLTAHTNNSDIHTKAADKSKWNKAVTDLTTHTGNKTIHITDAERTKWNDATLSSHTHSNKNVLDKITTIDTELSKTSNNLVVNSAITTAIQDKEIAISTSISDLDNKKLDATAYTPTDLSNYYKKEETSGRTALTSAFNSKANTSDLATKANKADLTAHIGDNVVHIISDERKKWNGKISNVQYNKTDKKIYFYSGATTETPVSNIDTIDFIKDGMVSNVEIKDVASSGSCLVITFNADAGKQNIVIPVSKIFNPANYYLKTELDAALNSKANTSELANYYLKTETSGSTQLNNAFGQKANTSDLTVHIGNSTIHITDAERTNWNNAFTSRHTHSNKAVLDKITAIDTELSEKSNNLVANSAITKTIQDKEKTLSTSISGLDKKKLDASAYTPVNLSNYYLKVETSGSSELNDAFGLKANTSDLTTHTGNTTVHIKADERTKWNGATTTLKSHSGNTTVHISSNERTSWNGKLSKVQYSKGDKKIYFYSGATMENPVSSIDATDFIKDGMVSNVEIKDVTNSGSCLVITFNADAGKQNIVIPVSKIFNPANYYLKSELDAALNSKANTSELTAHTGNTTVHIKADERTKWDKAATSSHTHSNKDVLDTITAIDKELSETSNNLVANSAITKTIKANAEAASTSISGLDKKKLDASAYTPVNLSNYYKKTETSGSSELNTAFGLKANTSDLTAHTGNSTIHITLAERTKWNGATTTLASHSGNTTVHINSNERTKWNGKISNVQYNKTDKKIYFYSGATTENPISNIDATDFIKDGMVSNVEIKNVTNSGSCLVITFNADSGKQNIVIPVSKIFNPANYYLKSETSGKTEISTALNSKANATDLTTHTGNKTVHITADERTKWNGAATTLASHSGDTTVHITSEERTKWNNAIHTHSNKAVLDKITAIDTQLSETSNNLVVNSAITKVIQDIEETISASLNDLNKRIKILEKEINALKAKIN